jgi:hypothetical protein
VFDRALGGKPIGADVLVSTAADVPRINPPSTEPNERKLA